MKIVTWLPTLPHVAVVTGLGGLVVLACWWWASPTFNIWETHDGPVHLLRSYVFGDLLQRGDWFPRWAPDLYLGYGYPVFNYVPPLPYYLAVLGYLLGLDRYGGLQAVGVMRQSCWGRPVPSVSRVPSGRLARPGYPIGSWPTSSLPYPFLYNLYIRGNVPEALGARSAAVAALGGLAVVA